MLKASIPDLKLLNAEPDPPIRKKEYLTGLKKAAFTLLKQMQNTSALSQLFSLLCRCLFVILVVPRQCNGYFTDVPSKREDIDPQHKITGQNF
jgi:hypothetical protein